MIHGGLTKRDGDEDFILWNRLNETIFAKNLPVTLKKKYSLIFENANIFKLINSFISVIIL